MGKKLYRKLCKTVLQLEMMTFGWLHPGSETLNKEQTLVLDLIDEIEM